MNRAIGERRHVMRKRTAFGRNHSGIRAVVLLPACLSLICLCGCLSVKQSHPQLLYHPKRIVNDPGWVGFFAGAIPAAVVTLPVTYPVGKSIDHVSGQKSNMFGRSQSIGDDLILGPPFFVGTIGSYIVGGPFWLTYGWWGHGGFVF